MNDVTWAGPLLRGERILREISEAAESGRFDEALELTRQHLVEMRRMTAFLEHDAKRGSTRKADRSIWQAMAGEVEKARADPAVLKLCPICIVAITRLDYEAHIREAHDFQAGKAA